METKPYSYQWDNREKLWMVITWSGTVIAMFVGESHAEMWTKLLNKQAYIVDKPPETQGESDACCT